MELIQFLYDIGIVFIILSLIWGFFMLILKMLAMGQRKGIFEEHLLRTANYYLIATLTAVVTIETVWNNGIGHYAYHIAGLIMLYLYLIGKRERRRMKVIVRSGMNPLNIEPEEKNKTIELIYLLGTLALYAFSVFYPEITQNSVTTWFIQAIRNIQETIIIGWIIQLVGVFFLINILFRGVVETNKLFSPQARQKPKDDQDNHHINGGGNNTNNDDYDDYEIVE